MIIAVDGPAAAGKGTLARRLGRHYGLIHLDTGLLYRAVALAVLRAHGDPGDEAAATHAARGLEYPLSDTGELRQAEVTHAASLVATMQGVRKAVLDYQVSMAQRPPGAILDGRDIGTVICPQADVKLFVTANRPERARRRYLELRASGREASMSSVYRDLTERDERDENRLHAPLRRPKDAYLLDTSNLDIDCTFATAVRFIDRHKGSKRA
ncbi:MAG: (d)CMP kinase [Hyphomicrobiales bacterium]